MTKPLLLFDMDGTLIIQSERPTYTRTETFYHRFMSLKGEMRQIAVSYGVPGKEVNELSRMAHIWNHSIRHMEDKGCPEDQIRSMVKELNVPFMMEERADHEVSVLLLDTMMGLGALKSQGYEMGLVTTASRESYDRISRDPRYGCFGDYFRYSVTRDECRYIKPEPEPIHRILKKYGRDDFIYIGDSDHDAQASHAASGGFVLINTREYDHGTIESLSPDAVINTLSELPEALERLAE